MRVIQTNASRHQEKMFQVQRRKNWSRVPWGAMESNRTERKQAEMLQMLQEQVKAHTRGCIVWSSMKLVPFLASLPNTFCIFSFVLDLQVDLQNGCKNPCQNRFVSLLNHQPIRDSCVYSPNLSIYLSIYLSIKSSSVSLIRVKVLSSSLWYFLGFC